MATNASAARTIRSSTTRDATIEKNLSDIFQKMLDKKCDKLKKFVENTMEAQTNILNNKMEETLQKNTDILTQLMIFFSEKYEELGTKYDKMIKENNSLSVNIKNLNEHLKKEKKALNESYAEKFKKYEPLVM